MGQRGESLSAGERQLVALVRAQLADPDLLVLDEATSAVDPALEMRISAALDRLTRGRTSVTIAHRMSTAERADLVVVVDRGRIVQVGSHSELVARGDVVALYQEIVDGLNRELSQFERIKRIAVLPAEFSIDSGELTPTLKVKRKVVEAKYKDAIAELYR